jgi:hypothetical protein
MSLSELLSGVPDLLRRLVAAPVAVPITPAPNGQGGLVAVPSGYTVQPLGGRKTGRCEHKIEDVVSLAAWLNRHGDPKRTQVLVGAVKVSAALDADDPTADLVTCPLAFHPRFEHWRALLGKTLSQRDFQQVVLSALSDFPDVTDSKGAVLGNSGSGLAAQLGRFSAKTTEEVEVEYDDHGNAIGAKAGMRHDVSPGKLPRSFVVDVPVLLGVDAPDGQARLYRVELFLAVEQQPKGPPTFTLSCPGLPIVLRNARLDARQYLVGLLYDGFLVGLGELAVQVVDAIAPKSAE